MELAYNIEIDEILDAESAYIYFKLGLIKNKDSFKCPNDECNAKVSCANIEKPKHAMKQQPHFRSYNHIVGCPYIIEYDDSDTENNFSEKVLNSEIDESIPDKLYVNISNTPNNLNDELRKNNRNADNEEYSGGRYRTIYKIIPKWLNYLNDKLLEERYITISGKDISYKELFKQVYHQEFSALSQNSIIYHGPAFINYSEKFRHYVFTFMDYFKLDGQQCRPSFIIYESQIKNFQFKEYFEKKIKKVINTPKQKSYIFIYGKPFIEKKKKSSYINFKINNLNLIDIREYDFIKDLIKLRKKHNQQFNPTTYIAGVI